ncbi:hypothetical protein PT974_04010 [Cladobotryum mycophilum]|uniref:Uncharacterized protein n=1 Tax=Cladobotryum mycophilum TaxID=491253 RepID=A0ABR0SUJ3_9HYPO
MKTAIFATIMPLVGYAVAQCNGDNCANHVTGTFAGIGVPRPSRISLCNDFLRTTIQPAPTTFTRTVTNYLTHVNKTTTSTHSTTSSSSSSTISSTSTRRRRRSTTTATTSTATTTTTTTTTSDANQTITPSVVPTYATAQCPDNGQFSSACKCWAEVTPRTTTLPTPTVTVTTTISLDVGCGPAATAVTNSTQFPCSNGEGMCSCLRTGDGNVCVRVANIPELSEDLGSAQANVTGPCAAARECNVDDACRGAGAFCVFDDSCACGKHRCYRAVAGCRDPGLPSYE